MFSIPGIESLPLAVQFAVLFVVIFAILALIILVLRRLTGGRVGMQGAERERARTRQPRLGIVDVYDLDRQRQLVLLRRDNVEHLLLIGGPNDVVIETNIVRSSAGRSATGVDSGDRAEIERTAEGAASRPVLETSWNAPNNAVAQIGQGEPAILPAAASAQPAAPRSGGSAGNAEAPGGLHKTLSQYLRRPESASQRAPEAGSNGRPPPPPQASAKAPRPAPATPAQPKPAPVSRATPTAAAASNGESKLPFGMRANARPKPAAPTSQPAPDARPASPAPAREQPPAAEPMRDSPRPASQNPQREPPQPMPQPDSAPPGDFSGELRPAEPSLVDTALLSDMAKQLETALRRPVGAALPENGTDLGETPPPPPALDRGASPPAQPATTPSPNQARPVAPSGNPGAAPRLQPATGPRAPVPPARAAAPPPPPPPQADEEESSDFDQPLGQGPADAEPQPPAPPPSAKRPGAPVAPDQDVRARQSFGPAPPAARQPAPSAEPTSPPAKPAQVDPFSMEDIEAEFARLLGRPLDKR